MHTIVNKPSIVGDPTTEPKAWYVGKTDVWTQGRLFTGSWSIGDLTQLILCQIYKHIWSSLDPVIQSCNTLLTQMSKALGLGVSIMCVYEAVAAHWVSTYPNLSTTNDDCASKALQVVIPLPICCSFMRFKAPHHGFALLNVKSSRVPERQFITLLGIAAGIEPCKQPQAEQFSTGLVEQQRQDEVDVLVGGVPDMKRLSPLGTATIDEAGVE